MSVPTECEVVIIGGGTAGASAAYHLTHSGVKDVVVLERGKVGLGQVGSSASNGELQFSRCSGTAVMSACSTIKMVLQLFTGDTSAFISHHGETGARRYLDVTAKGSAMQKDIAHRLLPEVDNSYKQLGFLYVAYEKDEKSLREEFITLRALGCSPMEWRTKEELAQNPACPACFHCAIYFPNDAIINSTLYAASLLQWSSDTGAVSLFEECPEVVSVTTEHCTGPEGEVIHSAVTVLTNGHRIRSKHAVLATGGLFTGDPNLSGIVRPCWSYLVAMPHPEAATSAPSNPSFTDGIPKYSCNFVTWGFTHDWCWTNGAVRISGEDHYSALKPPRAAERCGALAAWTQQAYPQVFGEGGVDPSAYSTQYGVYSETPDAVPVVGQVGPDSRVCYLLGCNALGQAVLSYAASLVPGLLGYRELSHKERENLALFDVKRFSLSAGVQGTCAKM